MKTKQILIIIVALAVVLGIGIAYFVPFSSCTTQKNKKCTLYEQYFPNVDIKALLVPMRSH